MTETTSAAPAAETAPPANVLANMPLGLFVFTLLYGGMTVLAGVLAFKQVRLWPTDLAVESGIFAFLNDLAVESGIFAFLLLVVISSTFAQIYGKKLANLVVIWGFLPLVVSIGLMALVLVLPVSPEMVAGRPGAIEAFEFVHGQYWRVVASGPVAYFVSLFLNIWIFDRLRGSGQSTTMGLMVRGAIASALSQAVDSVIFVTLAFYGEFDISGLLIGQVIAKVALSLVLVPFLITGGVKAAQWLDGRKNT